MEEEQKEKPQEEVKELNMVEQAREERERLEKAAAELRKENDRLEKLKASAMFAGESSAGTTTPKKKELSNTEYLDAVRSGDIKME